jgi:hypothetical protein
MSHTVKQQSLASSQLFLTWVESVLTFGNKILSVASLEGWYHRPLHTVNKEGLEVPAQHNDPNDIMVSRCNSSLYKPLV